MMFGKLLRAFSICATAILFANTAFACTSDEIDVLGDGTQCETTKFSVTTTSDATTLSWTMSATGTFYVNCGDGGTLTAGSTTISNNTITRTSTSRTTYTCSWPSAGVHTVRFGGTATGYDTTLAAISFYGAGTKVASVDGSLGAMFPVVNGNVPRFLGTFYGCSGLTSIPAGLFSGIDTSSATNTSYMFESTFYGCTNLTSIPAGLFSGIDTSSATNTSAMFESTFSGCKGLTGIPAGLFSAVNTSSATNTSYMFYQTFADCPNLSGYIPPTAFPSTIKPGSSSSYMWYRTFYNTKLATSCASYPGTAQYITGFESDWASNSNGGRVSCEQCAALPEHATYVANSCDWTCDSGYMNIDGACVEDKFRVTTTSDATTLSWTMTAGGTFYVDCGDNGTLNQNPASSYYSTLSGNTITRGVSTATPTYTCTWDTAGAHTVRFGGTATAYASDYDKSPISFYGAGTQSKVASVDGSLGAMFPVVNGNIPRFYQTFYGCTSLTSVPAGLFSGIDTSSATSTSSMFAQTFYNCTNLTSIPAGLFSGIDTSSATNTSYMFNSTFAGCSGLTSIPAGLFSSINTSSATSTSGMFGGAFSSCSKITSIPSGLFDSIDTSSSTNTSQMFQDTFYSCLKITSVPSGLFDSIDTSSATTSNNMFYRTFNNCSDLTSIPSGLFDSIDTSSSTNTSSMFKWTFSACGNLASIPSGLFDSIDTSSATNTNEMFNGTFSSCSNITSIPSGLFDSIDTSSSTSTSSMFQDTFNYCNKLTSIPSGLFDSIDTSSATNTSYMFQATFRSCSGLTGPIPSGLFDSIDTSSAINTSNMFKNTFYSCSKITSVPSGLFDSIDTSSSTNTSYMFQGTFSNCSGLTSIPAGLFASIDTSASTSTYAMFNDTFRFCSKLTSLPDRMFSAVDTRNTANTSGMFQNTFYQCTGMTGYIPPTAFPSTIKKGSSYNMDMWYGAFSGTKLVTSCPTGTGEYNTGFQNDWGYSNGNTSTSGTYRVSCEPCAALPEHATYVSGSCSWNCDDGYHADNDACIGNIITINWSGASQADIEANDAGSVTYGGDIRTPRAATTIPGKIFRGWKFSKPSGN